MVKFRQKPLTSSVPLYREPQILLTKLVPGLVLDARFGANE